MGNEELVTPTFRASLGQDGIVRLIWVDNVEVTLAAAKESSAAVAALTQGRTSLLLVDMRTVRSTDLEARRYYSGPRNTATRAIALLVGSSVSRVIASFFLRVNKPSIPTKTFTSEAGAIEWLKKMAQE